MNYLTFQQKARAIVKANDDTTDNTSANYVNGDIDVDIESPLLPSTANGDAEVSTTTTTTASTTTASTSTTLDNIDNRQSVGFNIMSHGNEMGTNQDLPNCKEDEDNEDKNDDDDDDDKSMDSADKDVTNVPKSPATSKRKNRYHSGRSMIFRQSTTDFDGFECKVGTGPRLVKRNLPGYQSEQQVDIVNEKSEWKLVYAYDWFHVLLRWPTCISLSVLIVIWTILIGLFGIVYYNIDHVDPSKACGLGTKDNPIDYSGAFAFSLETCTTVGYGLPGSNNSFFDECPYLQMTIYVQMVLSMLFNAFLFAFFFSRLSRAETRGHQVLFSNKAIFKYQNTTGKWMFHCRIYDLDPSQPLVEAHVRLYAVSWKMYEEQEADTTQPHLLHTLRITQPDDQLGSSMFTSVPATISHHIDAYSPLVPAHLREKSNVVHRNGLPLREVDRMVENCGGIPCPVCGETYGTYENLKRHIAYNKILEESAGTQADGKTPCIPIQGSHQDPELITPEILKPFQLTEDDIREGLQDKEIMVVFEGIEPLISGTFQALQSYKLEDIEFHGRFAPCMSHHDEKIFVDLEKFHEIQPMEPPPPPISPRKHHHHRNNSSSNSSSVNLGTPKRLNKKFR